MTFANSASDVRVSVACLFYDVNSKDSPRGCTDGWGFQKLEVSSVSHGNQSDHVNKANIVLPIQTVRHAEARWFSHKEHDTARDQPNLDVSTNVCKTHVNPFSGPVYMHTHMASITRPVSLFLENPINTLCAQN